MITSYPNSKSKFFFQLSGVHHRLQEPSNLVNTYVRMVGEEDFGRYDPEWNKMILTDEQLKILTGECDDGIMILE